MTLDLFTATQLDPGPTITRKLSITERWEDFHAANPHVFAAALDLARSWLARGDRYISAKAILEVLRVSVATTGERGYRINNDFSAPMSRALRVAEPALADVMRTRQAFKP